MNLADILLEMDKKILAVKTENYEVKRLSKLTGQKFEIVLQEVSPRRFLEIQNDCISFSRKGTSTTNLPELELRTLCEGIKSPEFKDTALLKRYNAATPKELYLKIFNAGEITSIYAAINRLSGISDEDTEQTVKAVKN